MWTVGPRQRNTRQEQEKRLHWSILTRAGTKFSSFPINGENIRFGRSCWRPSSRAMSWAGRFSKRALPSAAVSLAIFWRISTSQEESALPRKRSSRDGRFANTLILTTTWTRETGTPCRCWQEFATKSSFANSGWRGRMSWISGHAPLHSTR